MDFYDSWTKALQSTEIIRSRVQGLMTFKDTNVPYILLSESSINEGDTVVRTGEVVVEKPAIILPPNIPQFLGFEFEKGQDTGKDSLINFLLIRGVSLPSLKYNNQTYSLDIHEGKLSEAVKYYNDILQRQENVSSGLVVGPEDCWQFSLLLYICTQVARNANTDIRNLLKEFHDKNK
jgi:hypothetical protein